MNAASYHGVERRCFEPDDMAQMPDGGLYGAMDADEALAQAWDFELLPDNLEDCLTAALHIWHEQQRQTNAMHARRAWLLTLTHHHERALS